MTESASCPSGSATGAQEPADPLDQGAHGRFACLADDQVAFPVAGHLAARRLGRPLVDGPHPDDLRARALLAPAGFPLLTAGAQDNPGTGQLAFRLGVDPGIDCLVRYGHIRFSPGPLEAQPARYLLR